MLRSFTCRNMNVAKRLSCRLLRLQSMQPSHRHFGTYSNLFSKSDYILPQEKIIDNLMTPSLVIYLDQVRHNIRGMLSLLPSVEYWRPHVKTTKLPAIFKICFEEFNITKYKCATTRELDVLMDTLSQATTIKSPVTVDIIVSYAHVEPALSRIEELLELYNKRHEYVTFTVSTLCESIVKVPSSSSIGRYVDVNMGMNRTGNPVENVDEIIDICHSLMEQNAFRGLHAYEGHFHEEPFEVQAEAYDKLMIIHGALPSDTAIVTSGTPGFIHAVEYFIKRKQLPASQYQVSPGTVILHDVRSHDENPMLRNVLKPAALLLSRVISTPAPGMVTCDAGSKSIAAEVEQPITVALNNDALTALTPSEEHLPMSIKANTDEATIPKRGDLLYLWPKHICPTVNLAESVLLVEPSGDVPFRKEFVDGRAHEL